MVKHRFVHRLFYCRCLFEKITFFGFVVSPFFMPKERTVHTKTFSSGPAPTGASGGLGQHFIKNIAVVHNIVEKAGIKPTDIVLEIGPGNGIMTMELLKKAKKVIAIELDPRMVNEVQKKVQGTYRKCF